MWEEIKNIKSDKTELQKFARTIGTVLIVISILLFLSEKPSARYFFVAGFVVIFLGKVFPKILLPLQKLWMTFAVLMGFVMTRVILAVLFYLIITPISLITKLLGKDFLNLKIEKEKKSYWNLRNEEYDKNLTEKQF